VTDAVSAAMPWKQVNRFRTQFIAVNVALLVRTPISLCAQTKLENGIKIEEKKSCKIGGYKTVVGEGLIMLLNFNFYILG
jgi:hypothetical protein